MRFPTVLPVAFAFTALIPIQAPPARAAVQVSYTCDLGGQPAQMTALIEAVSSSGVTYNPQGGISGVIGTGDYTLYYQGELRSQTAYYVFTGENAYADFTDMMTYATFRVQFTAQADGGLVLTANPFGPGPVSYLCTFNQPQ